MADDLIRQVQAMVDAVQKNKEHPFWEAVPVLHSLAVSLRSSEVNRDLFQEGLLATLARSGFPPEAIAALLVFRQVSTKKRRRVLGRLLREGMDGGWLPSTATDVPA